MNLRTTLFGTALAVTTLLSGGTALAHPGHQHGPRPRPDACARAEHKVAVLEHQATHVDAHRAKVEARRQAAADRGHERLVARLDAQLARLDAKAARLDGRIAAADDRADEICGDGNQPT